MYDTSDAGLRIVWTMDMEVVNLILDVVIKLAPGSSQS